MYFHSSLPSMLKKKKKSNPNSFINNAPYRFQHIPLVQSSHNLVNNNSLFILPITFMILWIMNTSLSPFSSIWRVRVFFSLNPQSIWYIFLIILVALLCTLPKVITSSFRCWDPKCIESSAHHSARKQWAILFCPWYPFWWWPTPYWFL